MSKVIGFVMVGTNDLEKSSKFYDAILVHLGMKRISKCHPVKFLGGSEGYDPVPKERNK